MTYIESIEWSIKIWAWLHDNPLKGKTYYPDISIQKLRGHCPLCEYFNEQMKLDCEDGCPLDDIEGCAGIHYIGWSISSKPGQENQSQYHSGEILKMLYAALRKAKKEEGNAKAGSEENSEEINKEEIRK